MRKIVLGMAMLSFLFLCMDCATVLNGAQQDVTFNSSPEGAQVFIDGGLMGETPLTLKLKKNAYDNIMVKKEGFETQNVPLDKAFDGVAVLNIFWDLSTTDLITGALYEYKPNQYHFELKEGAANWLYNNGRLDRESQSDLRAFILRKYFRFKHAQDSDEYRGLIQLVVRAYYVSEIVAEEVVDPLLIETDTPLDFIKRLDQEFWELPDPAWQGPLFSEVFYHWQKAGK